MEIVAPKVLITQEAVLSTQPGKTLSFTCEEGFACLGKVDAVKTKISASKTFMGTGPYLKRRIRKLSKEEADQQFSDPNETQKIIIITSPNHQPPIHLYFSKSAEFRPKLEAFLYKTPWVKLRLFPEERLLLYRHIIDQVTVKEIQRKRASEVKVNCSEAARDHSKRRK